MKKLFTLFLMLAVSVGTLFAKVKIGDLYYNLNYTFRTAEVTYEVDAGSDNYFGLTTANIPDTITYQGTTYSVTSIGDRAFSHCISLTSITIPNSVTSIVGAAFANCGSLTSITIPNSVTIIGNKAFYYCHSLTSITIPNSVTSIGYGAFGGCSNLTSIAVTAGNTFYDSRNSCNAIIETASNALIAGCPNTTIPDGVTSIGDYVFSGCSGLESIAIPNSVTSIGNYAFYDCSSLASITIPDSVTGIGGYAFYGCTSLASITIPNNLMWIGNYAFSRCSHLASITIPNSVTYIGIYAFSGCYFQQFNYGGSSQGYPWGATIVDERTQDGLIIKDHSIVKYVGNGSIVTIPHSVTSIGNRAFGDCSGLTSITIPNSVTSIGSSAFMYCSGLTSITIPNSVTSIGSSAFSDCYFLELNYGGSATGYPWGATIVDERTLDGFIIKDSSIVRYVGNSSTVTIPNNVTSIGDYAFGMCYNLISVTIPNSVTSIGDRAFELCYQLTSVTIPNSVTSIGEDAFYECFYLTSITIPNSVTSIGLGAFSECFSLTSIICEAVTPPALGLNVFYYVDTSIPLYVPATSIALYQAAEQWQDFMNIQAISDDAPTGVYNTSVAPQSDESRKVFENGNIYILRDGKTYTLQGQEVK